MDQDQIRKTLFNNYTQLYGVLDGVMVPDLPNRLYKGQVPNYCLLTGDLSPDVVYAAPYLVYLSPDSKFADWVFEQAFGKHWGVFVQSPRSMIEMRRHFRALMQAYDENGNPMKFRFYDPRVLSKFLPTCNGGELKTLFGEVQAFYTESENGDGIVRYKIDNGKLVTTLLNKDS
ncbi:MAG: DUF4123 domain-containing protein [Pyrinomonadaceae bacterium]